eukprot:TRINITY_DN9005_c0_g3_i1.p1 TRINITY_DN9005_c0_g3~~TRINITY_DN9005_c0_g3_i1.p1  ORF type:complete len:153 (+),score=46.69 TRINITY_DN9005_c0_g3_i1:339-797(+)
MPECTSYGQRLAMANGEVSEQLLREELAAREHTILKLRVRMAEMARQMDQQVVVTQPKSSGQLKAAIKRAEAAEARAAAAEVRVRELELELQALRNASNPPVAPVVDSAALHKLRASVEATLEEATKKLEQWWVLNESAASKVMMQSATVSR